MLTCPVCERPTPDASLVRMPYVYGDSLELILRINPNWKREDGACRTCLEAVLNTASELEDARAEQRPSTTGFRQYYRHVLSTRESGQWHHKNSDMQRWRQAQIVERIGDEAHEHGFDCWLVLDVDEALLAQGVAVRGDD